MTFDPTRHHTDPSEEALETVREAYPELADDDLIEHRPADDPPPDERLPLHDPWWAPM